MSPRLSDGCRHTWENSEVYCVDCGDHPALYCDECGAVIDLICEDDPRE